MLTIYKASAGSGKTYTLTYEFLKQLLGVKENGAGRYHLNSDKYTPSGRRRHNRHHSILAITFTNAATSEMKGRIIRDLAKLASGEGAGESKYVEWLTAEYGCTAAELQEVAGKALAELLYDYGNFNVSTIDSFFQTVLRTFSREVDHQGDYELSLDTKDVVRQSLSLMLDELNYSQPRYAKRLFDWIQRYTLDRVNNGNGYNFFNRDGAILYNLTKNLSDTLNDETYRQYSGQLREYLRDPARVEMLSKELLERAENAMTPAKECAKLFLSRISEAGYSTRHFNATIMLRMAELMAGTKLSDLTGAIISKAANGETGPEKLLCSVKNLKEWGINKAELLPYAVQLPEFCRLLQRGALVADFYRTLHNSLGILDFYGMAVLKLEEYLRDNNTVLISDTGELLRRIISDAEMPFIYERLGMQLDSLLIDEFQDTSHIQWHNLRPLVANSLAEGHDSLIIGDEKQAIYRFRNSDSELLGHIVQTRDFPNSHSLRGFSVADNTNHRSAAGIVRVNNSIFSRMARNLSIPGYENVVQTPSNDYLDLPAYAKICFHSESDTNVILEQLAQDILAQHSRGYRWRDILVLVRAGSEAVNVAEYLSSMHPEIALLSSEALLLSSSSAVRTIMSMLKLIEQSYVGKETRSNIDGSAPKYASQSDVVMMITRYNYYRSKDYDAADALKLALDSTDETADALDEQIRKIRAENPANLVALIEAVIAHKITERQRSSEYAYISALQDLAIKHTESPDPSLAAFIAAYEANIDKWAVKASADIDAVEVMTIHKSKGLERDCIHIPFGDWKLTHSPLSAWLPMHLLTDINPEILPPTLPVIASTKSALRDASVSPFAQIYDDCERAELIDNINLCYVSFTRASRELIVYSKTQHIGKELLTALSAGADSDELADTSRIDLAEYFDAETSTFTFGKPTHKVEKKKTSKKDETTLVEAGSYPVFFHANTRGLTAIDDALSEHIDIGGEADKYITDTPEHGSPAKMIEAAQRGNQLHAILASTRTVADLQAAVARMAVKEDFSDAEQQSCYTLLKEAIDAGGSTVAGWFDPRNKIYAERSIFVPDNEGTPLPVSYRPDRIVISPDGTATVVDYKFTSEARPEHFEQVENYMSLLTSLGYEKVNGYLWFPLFKEVKKV